jgi:hypothetical protein
MNANSLPAMSSPRPRSYCRLARRSHESSRVGILAGGIAWFLQIAKRLPVRSASSSVSVERTLILKHENRAGALRRVANLMTNTTIQAYYSRKTTLGAEEAYRHTIPLPEHEPQSFTPGDSPRWQRHSIQQVFPPGGVEPVGRWITPGSSTQSPSLSLCCHGRHSCCSACAIMSREC